jgi:hypothetical protein
MFTITNLNTGKITQIIRLDYSDKALSAALKVLNAKAYRARLEYAFTKGLTFFN